MQSFIPVGHEHRSANYELHRNCQCYVTGVTLQSSTNTALYSFTLTDGEHSTVDDPTIMIILTISKLNEIKRIQGLAHIDNTYVPDTT